MNYQNNFFSFRRYTMNNSSNTESYETMREYLTTKEAAVMLGLSLGTVQKMVEQGELVAWKTSGGHRRVKHDSVMRYLKMNCNLAQYESRNYVSLMQVELSAEMRTHYLQVIASWGLPVRVHFVDDIFHLLMRMVQVAPDIILLDLDDSPCDGIALAHSLKRHESVHSTDVLYSSSMSNEQLIAKGGLPNHVMAVARPISMDLLRGFVCAKLASKGS